MNPPGNCILPALGVSPVPAASAGIGLKSCHFEEILETRPSIGWFEVHPENYLVEGGPMHHYLSRIRAEYPLSFHSVGMSLGSADGVDRAHLGKLKTLIDRYQPALLSDHLSWSRWHQVCLNDLLPMPYTVDALASMADNIYETQLILERRIAIENPSSYFDIEGADMDECDFLIELAERSGCSILLDVNNVYVSACNHGWSARDYIERIPSQLINEMHLAGHALQTVSTGEIRIDDHGSRVSDQVWDLYRHTLEKNGPHPTLIEWDTDVPAFGVLLDEAAKAQACLQDSGAAEALSLAHTGSRTYG